MLSAGDVSQFTKRFPGAGNRVALFLSASLVGLAHGTSLSGPDPRPPGALPRLQGMAEHRVPAMAEPRWISSSDGLRPTTSSRAPSGAYVAGGAASHVDTERFAQAMSDMRFLFDEDVERFVSGIYDAALKKHALDALLEKADGHGTAPCRPSADRASARQEPGAGQPNQQRHLSGNAGAHGKVHAAPASVLADACRSAGGAAIASACAPRGFRQALSPPIALGSPETFGLGAVSATIRNDLLVSF